MLCAHSIAHTHRQCRKITMIVWLLCTLPMQIWASEKLSECQHAISYAFRLTKGIITANGWLHLNTGLYVEQLNIIDNGKCIIRINSDLDTKADAIDCHPPLVSCSHWHINIPSFHAIVSGCWEPPNWVLCNQMLIIFRILISQLQLETLMIANNHWFFPNGFLASLKRTFPMPFN